MNHSFDVHIATEYKSVEVAILVWHFQYWIGKNKRLGKNEHEGRTWTYQTYMDIAALFPYWSRDQVKRLLKKSIELKILINGNFNKSSYDRTMWYAFSDESKFGISKLSKIDEGNEGSSGTGRNRPMDKTKSPDRLDEIAPPIPNTITNTLTKKKEDASAQALDAGNSSVKNLKTLRKEKRPQHNVYYQPEPEELTNNVKESEANNKNEYRSLALSFHSRLKQHNPKIKSIDIEKWAKELSLLAKDGEGSSVQEIEKVIEYVISTHSKPSANGFCWANIILSPNSLRKNFSRIWAEINSKNSFKLDGKDNEKLADEVYKKYYKKMPKDTRIDKGNNDIQFIWGGMSNDFISFDDKEFKNKLEKAIKKIKA